MKPDTLPAAPSRGTRFFGWRVVGAAFVLAVFGWGTGFYAPPVFLSVVHETRGWPVSLISAAVTVQFLVGAFATANLPLLYRRYGLAVVTKAAAVSAALGICGWALAAQPWQMFLAAVFSGAGWAAMSAAALNAIVSIWFVRARPAALAMAYNGASIGGVVFSPLWVVAIDTLGFFNATLVIGATLALSVWMLADRFFSKTPQQMWLAPDGEASDAPAAITPVAAKALPGRLLWRDRSFLTLAAGMSLGLFAQIGLITHLFSLLLPALGARPAGLAMALITVMAIGGRTLLGATLPLRADRRLVACGGYVAQVIGSVVLIFAAGNSVPLLILGVVLFGAGFGNATSLPPLIAQVEFADSDVQRAVALMLGIAQATYAFSPGVFGLLRELSPSTAAPGAAPYVFAAAGLCQAAAIVAFLAGRGRRPPSQNKA